MSDLHLEGGTQRPLAIHNPSDSVCFGPAGFFFPRTHFIPIYILVHLGFPLTPSSERHGISIKLALS